MQVQYSLGALRGRSVIMRRSTSVALSAVLSAAALVSPPAYAQRLVADAGITQIGWLIPAIWGPSVGVQMATLRSEHTALIVSARSVFGRTSIGSGMSRRDVVGTAAMGVEQKLVQATQVTLLGALSLAGSYTHSSYSSTGSATFGARTTSVHPILAVRLAQRRITGLRLSVRADIQPHFDAPRSLNPSMGVGLSW